MLGDFSFIYWTFSQKLFFWGGCRTWCNSLSKVAWLKYVENMAPVTQYDSKCQTRKTHQPSIGIIHPAHVSLSGCCKRQRFNIDTKNDAFKKKQHFLLIFRYSSFFGGYLQYIICWGSSVKFQMVFCCLVDNKINFLWKTGPAWKDEPFGQCFDEFFISPLKPKKLRQNPKKMMMSLAIHVVKCSQIFHNIKTKFLAILLATFLGWWKRDHFKGRF